MVVLSKYPNYKELYMDNDTIKTVFKKFLYPLHFEFMQQMINNTSIDKYVKKLGTISFIKLFIYAQLKGHTSLRRISQQVKRKKTVQRLTGLQTISSSQLSRKLRDIPPSFLYNVLQNLIQELHLKLAPSRFDQITGKIHLIDSSTISMCLSGYEWADFRETKSGIKMHTSIILCDDDSYLNDMILTPARPADETQLDTLIVPDKDALHVFDRGYFNFTKFSSYCEQGIRFVTRTKSNTIVNVIEELELPSDPSSTIIRDAIVTIGMMEHPLRLIETLDNDGNKISVVCNDLNIDGQEISDLYQSRWQIELFFRWIKQNLVIKKLYGKSQNAVFNQIYLAMITFCLNLLLKNDLGYQGTLLEMMDWVSDCWSNRISNFVKKLFEKPTRTTKGRQRPCHERIFDETLAQYESGDVSHLDDQTYDPVI